MRQDERAPFHGARPTPDRWASPRERLVEPYRKKAKHYDLTSRLYPVPGYPVRAQRRAAVQALRVRPGDTVIDVACGTGLNFPLIQSLVGSGGQIVGVDMTDAMLEQAERRVARNGWRNVSLVQSDAADFRFPPGADAILSTYALTQMPHCADVVVNGAESLRPGGRWVVLDVALPAAAPQWLVRIGVAFIRSFASIDQWIERRPADAIRAAMQRELADVSWTELCFGTAFLAAGSRR